MPRNEHLTRVELVAEIDAKVGAFGVVPKEFDGAIVSGHYFLYNIDTVTVRPDFLQCYVASGILTEKGQQYIQSALNYAAIRPHQILGIQIPFPPPELSAAVQSRVINHFMTIRNMRRHAERQLEAIVAIERQWMREAFDFEP